MRVHDIDFEPGELDNKDKEEVGFYTYRNMKFVDCADLESPHTVMVPLRAAKPEEVVRIIVQNLEDEEFFGSISVPLKKYFLNENIIKNHEYTQWMTLFDDPEDDEYDGDFEEDDPDHPKILVTFSITEVQGGSGGDPALEGGFNSMRTGEVDESSVITPPRDIDLTSQIEMDSEVVAIEKQKTTKSMGQSNAHTSEEFKEYRHSSSSVTLTQQHFVQSSNVI